MKKYIKSLFPFRWILILIFIFLTSIIIKMGFLYESNPPKYFTNAYLWYGGNFIFWFIIDFLFGIGQKNFWDRK